MDYRKGLPLALVTNTKSDAAAPRSGVVPLCVCGSTSAETAQGTVYCCDSAELVALRNVVAELDRRLAVELEDPPQDLHLARFLSYTRARVHQARGLPSK